jgi:hypothetical protein
VPPAILGAENPTVELITHTSVPVGEMVASYRDDTVHGGDADAGSGATDRGATGPSLTEVYALVERSGTGPWECTLFAVDGDETWVAASEGSFVSLVEME